MRWLLPILLTGLGCSGSAGDSGTSSSKTQPWSGGDFDFYTESSVDGCLGGALEALFMPAGPAEPHAFEFPIYLPEHSELPFTSEVDLRAPFVEMPVTIEDAGQGSFMINGAVMEAVELGSAAYGDCVVTMTVQAQLTVVDNDTLNGEAEIAISDPRGAEDRCPVFTENNCSVELTLKALRR